MVGCSVITDADNLDASLSKAIGRHRSHIAEPLDDGGRVVRADPKVCKRAADKVRHPASGRFAAAERASRRHRLSGDDLVDRLALIHGIGVHEPGHDLRVRAHIGGHYVGMRTDQRDHLLHVAPRERLEFARRQGVRINRNASLGSPIGKSRQRTFPAHPDRQGGDFADIHRECKALPPLVGPSVRWCCTR